MTNNKETRDMSTTMIEQIQEEIKAEVAEHQAEKKVLVYGKGTADAPRCGFTMSTKAFFDELGVEYHIMDVLENPEKRQVLAEMTDWPTLPKVFINGEFYGDLDILLPMKEKGELADVLSKAGMA